MVTDYQSSNENNEIHGLINNELQDLSFSFQNMKKKNAKYYC